MSTSTIAAPDELIMLDNGDNVCVRATGAGFLSRTSHTTLATLEVVTGPEFPGSCMVTVAELGRRGLHLHLDAAGAAQLPEALRQVIDHGGHSVISIDARNLDGGRAGLIVARLTTTEPSVTVSLADLMPPDDGPVFTGICLHTDDARALIPPLADTIAPLVANTQETWIEVYPKDRDHDGGDAHPSPRWRTPILVLSAAPGLPTHCMATITAPGKPELILRLDRPSLVSLETTLLDTIADRLDTKERSFTTADLAGSPVDVFMRNATIDGADVILLTTAAHDGPRSTVIALPYTAVTGRLIACIHNRIRPRVGRPTGR